VTEGSTKSFEMLRQHLLDQGLGKSAADDSGHVTDTVDTGAVDHPPKAEDDVELGEIGPAAITDELTLDTETNETPPAKVPDSGVVQDANIDIPPESPGHPTNEKLKEQPKAAALKQAGTELEAALLALQELLPKAAEETTKEKTVVPDDTDNSEEVTEDADSEKEAGYDAAKKIGTLMIENDKQEKKAAVDSFLEFQIIKGIEDGHKYADFLDGFIDQTVPAMAAAEGGGASGLADAGLGEAGLGEAGLGEELGAEEDTVATLEELGAMINALASGKEPQSDAERELLQILTEAGLITPDETGVEDAEIVESDLGADTIAPDVASTDPALQETKLASLLAEIKGMSTEQMEALVKGEKN